MNDLIVLGRAETIAFPESGISSVPARIDTGAKTSSIWVSQAVEKNGLLSVVFLGKSEASFTGKEEVFKEFEEVMVATSTGQIQKRYKVQLLVKIKGKKVRANFTLADRSAQVYPVLIGRNVLRGKFVVDVKTGTVLSKREKIRSKKIQSSKSV